MRTAVLIMGIVALQVVLLFGFVGTLLFSPEMSGQSSVVIAFVFLFAMVLTGGMSWYAVGRHILS